MGKTRDEVSNCLTVNILSAEGRFLGFLTNATFMKLCNSGDLNMDIKITDFIKCHYQHKNNFISNSHSFLIAVGGGGGGGEGGESSINITKKIQFV